MPGQSMMLAQPPAKTCARCRALVLFAPCPHCGSERLVEIDWPERGIADEDPAELDAAVALAARDLPAELELEARGEAAALADELRRVHAAGRDCPLLHVLEVASGAAALASLGVDVELGDTAPAATPGREPPA